MSSTNLQELNLSHNFLFPAALEDPQTCRLVVECITGETVGELKVKAEYTKLNNPEFKCIRLDVYAKDVVTEISYNLEMQNKNEYNLPLRSRYYQAQIDVTGLKPGAEYLELKPLYVIFICNFDPFDQERYRYTFSMQCEESQFPLDDGVKRIFFNTKGKNSDEVPKILIDFLGYLNDSTDAYVEHDLDEKVKKIHERVKLLKQDRNVEKNYMHYLSVEKLIKAKDNELAAKENELAAKDNELAAKDNELAAKENELAAKDNELAAKDNELAAKDNELAAKDSELEEAKRRVEEEKRRAEEATKKVEQEKQNTRNQLREMLFENIAELGSISKVIHEEIEKEEDINVLKSMHKIAVKAGTVEQFEKQIAGL